MTFLPIAERELRVAARRRGTYWLRFLVPAGLMLIACWIFLVSQRVSQRESGVAIFYMLTGGLTLYSLLAGLRSTADCLSEEKRDGTLGLLFLTDLRGYDVVAGKLMANSLATFYCVLAVLPVLAIPLLMGGVAVTEVGRLSLVIVNTLFFSLSAGMFASAMCKNARAALGLTLAVLLVVTAGSPALGLWEWYTRHWMGSYQFAFLIPSPLFAYAAGLDSMYTRGALKGFYLSVGCVHLCGWLLLGMASLVVRRSWQDRPSSAKGERRRTLLRSALEGDDEARHAFRSRLLDENAYFWLAARPRYQPIAGWVPLILAGGIWAWGYLKLGDDWLNPGIYAATAFLLGVTMKAMIGAEAGRKLLEDRKLGALELLLSTSLPVREILRGQRLALLRQFLWPVTAMLAVDLWMLIAGANHPEMRGGDGAYWIWGGLGGLVMFVTDVVALYWMGMWLGLSVKNPRHAFGAAIVPILTLPWVGLALVMTVIALMPYQMSREFRGNWIPMALWFGFSIAVDSYFGLAARHKLMTRFREVASQRYQAKASLWQRIFGKRIETLD